MQNKIKWHVRGLQVFKKLLAVCVANMFCNWIKDEFESGFSPANQKIASAHPRGVACLLCINTMQHGEQQYQLWNHFLGVFADFLSVPGCSSFSQQHNSLCKAASVHAPRNKYVDISWHEVYWRLGRDTKSWNPKCVWMVEPTQAGFYHLFDSSHLMTVSHPKGLQNKCGAFIFHRFTCRNFSSGICPCDRDVENPNSCCLGKHDGIHHLIYPSVLIHLYHL